MGRLCTHNVAYLNARITTAEATRLVSKGVKYKLFWRSSCTTPRLRTPFSAAPRASTNPLHPKWLVPSRPRASPPVARRPASSSPPRRRASPRPPPAVRAFLNILWPHTLSHSPVDHAAQPPLRNTPRPRPARLTLRAAVDIMRRLSPGPTPPPSSHDLPPVPDLLLPPTWPTHSHTLPSSSPQPQASRSPTATAPARLRSARSASTRSPPSC